MLTISIGTSRQDTDWQKTTMTWPELAGRFAAPRRTRETVAEWQAMDKDTRDSIKDIGGFVGGELLSGHRRWQDVTSRCLIALDADYGNPGLWEDWQLMVGAPALMHATHSHTPENPRMRLLIPLARPVTAAEYEPIARQIAQMLGIDQFDDSTYQANRLMFWPSIPRDGEYVLEQQLDGEFLDPDAILAQYVDWRDIGSWPVSSRREAKIRRMGDRQGDPLAKPGIVGAFNRAYSITAAIQRFLPDVYTPCRDGRWTYTNGSTTGGAVIYDSDTFLFSHHSTDPVSGRLCNAYDLVRLHKFGHLDNEEELADAPSTREMRTLCAEDEGVRAELAAGLTNHDLPFDKLDDLERFRDDLTEQGLALQFVDRFGRGLRYSASFGWLFWDGSRWQLDAEAEACILAMRFADELMTAAKLAMAAAKTVEEREIAEARIGRIKRLRSSAGLKNLLTLSKAVLNDPEPDSYDRRAWEINTPDGIIHLDTGEITPADPRAKHTKITAVSIGPGDTQMWQGFLAHITGGDKTFEAYLQTLAGMAAVGAVYEEGLIISYGPGGNGKSTFFGALRRVLGDYAKSINPDVLVSHTGQNDQSYVAALRGIRLALLSETEEGARLGAAQMKRLTSRDSISARALYKDPVEFEPVHTAIMHTNHLPRLSSMDSGTRRRIAVVPFPATLPPEKTITDFERRLVQECGGVILQWIIQGAQAFHAADCKLAKPPCVVEATEEYLEDADWLQQFLDEECVSGAGHAIRTGELYNAYALWSKARNGGFAQRSSAFKAAMQQKGYQYQRLKTDRKWLGINLKQDEEEKPF